MNTNFIKKIMERRLSFRRQLSILSFSVLLIGGLSLPLAGSAQKQMDVEKRSEYNGVAARWSEEKANQWYKQQPWIVGCNYVTSTAINQIEMWQADSFDPQTIDRELAMAQSIGFNTVRIFFHNLVWEENPKGFKKRLNKFLDIAQKHNIRIIATFLTNGTYHKSSFPKLGKQKEAIKGVHNSGWVQAPGADIVNDSTKWTPIEGYIKDIVGSFKDDKRILFWSLYNEPENRVRGAKSLPLLRKVFEWARSVNPSQPLTSPIWKIPGNPTTAMEIVSFLGENCDIITFHTYEKPEVVNNFIKLLQNFNRPLVCTEYMGRTRGSTFENTMPIFKDQNIGAISFGLVAGKTNFYYPWGSKAGDPEPKLWFHDIFRQDGSAFSEDEIRFIKGMTGAN